MTPRRHQASRPRCDLPAARTLTARPGSFMTTNRPAPSRVPGRLTQWLECVLHTDEVTGSNPVSPTETERPIAEAVLLTAGWSGVRPQTWDSAEDSRKPLERPACPDKRPLPPPPPFTASLAKPSRQ